MSENIRELMDKLKTQLRDIYGQLLVGVYLFGSYARDEQNGESDVDVMIVLRNYDSYSSEIERTGEIISELSLKYDLSISRIFIDHANWLKGDTPLLRNVRQEATRV